MRSLFRAAGAALALVALLAPLPSPAQTQPPYLIPVVLSLTGAAAFSAQSHHETLEEFERFTNAHGGIKGRPIHFDFHDDTSNPATAVQITNALIATKTPIILGSGIVATCSAIAPLVAASGPVQFCFSPGFFPKPGSYSFSGSTSLDYLVPTVLRFMRDKGYKRLAFISATDATGQSADKASLDGLKKPENAGITVTDYEHFNPTDVSVTAQITNLKASHPEGVVVWASGPAFGTVLRALNDAGVDVPVLTSAANMNKTQLDQYARFVPKELYFNTFRFFDRAHIAPGPLKTNVEAFYDQFRKDGVQVAPDSSYAWDVGMITVAALRDLGVGATPEQIRDYIEKLHNFAGINGTYDFSINDQHGLTEQAVLVVRWQPDKHDWVAVSGPNGKPL